MSAQKIDLSKLGPEQLAAVRQQFDQELQHFSQSLQALTIARNKFRDCIEDIKSVTSPENKNQKLLVPASASLYIPGVIVDKTFMVDVGTGYYVDKSAEEAISFYEKKISKLNKESIQIQDIIKEKSQYSQAIEVRIRQTALAAHEERKRHQQQEATNS